MARLGILMDVIYYVLGIHHWGVLFIIMTSKQELRNAFNISSSRASLPSFVQHGVRQARTLQSSS